MKRLTLKRHFTLLVMAAFWTTASPIGVDSVKDFAKAREHEKLAKRYFANLTYPNYKALLVNAQCYMMMQWMNVHNLPILSVRTPSC